MEEIGIVKSVSSEGGAATARVVFEKKSACEHCLAGVCDMGRKETDGGAATASNGGAAASSNSLALLFDTLGNAPEAEVLNPIGARVGQKVRVSMRPDVYLKGVLLVYGLPVTALIFGAVAGKYYLPRFISAVDVEALSAAGGFAAFAASFLFAKYFSKRMEKNASYRPVIEEIIE
jgi:sigma-E factor negative regulatory protein RseC